MRYLREQGRTSINDLVNHFNITGASIRSDLRQLEQAHLVTRRYGGAEAISQPIAEDPQCCGANRQDRHRDHRPRYQ